LRSTATWLAGTGKHTSTFIFDPPAVDPHVCPACSLTVIGRLCKFFIVFIRNVLQGIFAIAPLQTMLWSYFDAASIGLRFTIRRYEVVISNWCVAIVLIWCSPITLNSNGRKWSLAFGTVGSKVSFPFGKICVVVPNIIVSVVILNRCVFVTLNRCVFILNRCVFVTLNRCVFITANYPEQGTNSRHIVVTLNRGVPVISIAAVRIAAEICGHGFVGGIGCE
jgi:hypothetical protein